MTPADVSQQSGVTLFLKGFVASSVSHLYWGLPTCGADTEEPYAVIPALMELTVRRETDISNHILKGN